MKFQVGDKITIIQNPYGNTLSKEKIYTLVKIKEVENPKYNKLYIDDEYYFYPEEIKLESKSKVQRSYITHDPKNKLRKKYVF